MKSLHNILCVVLVAVSVVGCATPSASIPKAPPRSAPAEERVAWAKKYSLVPGEIGDVLGNGTPVYDLKDLAQGIDNDALKVSLATLEGPQNEQRIGSLIGLGGLGLLLGAYVATGFVDENDADANLVVLGVGAAGLVAYFGGTLWAGDAGVRAERSRSRIRMFYSHMIEEELDVEVTSRGDVLPRSVPTAGAAPQPTDPPTPLPTPDTAPEAAKTE